MRSLDEAAAFLRQHGPGRGHNWEGLLRRLQVASGPDDCRDAGKGFIAWLEAEALLDPVATLDGRSEDAPAETTHTRGQHGS